MKDSRETLEELKRLQDEANYHYRLGRNVVIGVVVALVLFVLLF